MVPYVSLDMDGLFKKLFWSNKIFMWNKTNDPYLMPSTKT